jgi:hypothetical protein
MFIGIVADSHDNLPLIDHAVRLLADLGAEVILHAGDIVSPFAAKKFAESGIKVYAVYGNNDGEKEGLAKVLDVTPSPRRVELVGKTFVIAHSLAQVKDTDKGPMVWEAKATAIYLQRDGLPTWPHWVIFARNVENPDEIKFFIANAPAGTPLEVLLYVGFSRAHVERCFEDEKSELGLSHFELRNYRGLQRHLIVTALTHLFLAEAHKSWRGEKSGVDGLPASDGQFRVDPLLVGVRKRPQEVPGKSGLRYPANAGSQPTVAAVPREDQAQAVA